MYRRSREEGRGKRKLGKNTLAQLWGGKKRLVGIEKVPGARDKPTIEDSENFARGSSRRAENRLICGRVGGVPLEV